MFNVVHLEDDIRVQPQDLSKPPLDAVTDCLEQLYIDRVIPELGLVVTIYDVQDIQGGFIYPNDGAAFFKVKFRLVVFKPFVGEVIVARLKSCSREGLHLSLGFFDDILIPEHLLQEPSFYEDHEKVWVWKFEGNDLYMDPGHEVRFKVHQLRFNKPPTPLERDNATGDAKNLGTAAKPFAPFEVLGDISQDGLGLLSWWGAGEEAAEGEEEA